MWPFTSRRIFGSRWWALAFVGYVCWQVADTFAAPAPAGNNAEASATDLAGGTIDDAQMQQMADTFNSLNSLQNSN